MADEQLVALTIDGVSLSVPKGTLLVEAAKSIKQEIPVYCYHPKLGPAGLCRVCLVEIEGMPKLQIACNTPVADGMVVHTQNAKVDAGRGMILELLLVNHPLDCPICDKGGECDLQDYAMAYARGTSDLADPKVSKPKGVELGPTIVLDEERCVVCQRCVRFDDIIARESQLIVKDRGVHDIIATSSGDAYRHNFTGNVTELCPVGALTSKTYRFKSRPWDLNRTETSCTQCAVGCRQFSDVRFANVLRTMSVESDDAISDGWLCDRGRYNIGFYGSPDRLTQPLYRHGDQFAHIGWDDAFALWAKALKAAIADDPASAAALGGGRLLNEEAYVLQRVFRGLGIENVDWRTGSQTQATPGDRSGSLVALESADAIVLAGESPQERAPVMWLRILKAVAQRKAKLIRVAPECAPPNVACTDVANVADAMKLISPGARVALVWDGVDPALGAELYDGAKDFERSTYITGESPNGRGAEAMGMLPKTGARTGAQAFEAAAQGNMRVLSLFGVNPVRNAPNPDAIRAALRATPFVAVSELFMTETAELATLVLPAKGAFEKSGTTLNATGDLLPVNRSLDAPAGVLSDLEMLVGLAQYVDLSLPTHEQVDAAVIAAVANPTLGFAFGDARFGAGNGEAVYRSIWDGGGTSAHDERIAALRPSAPPVVAVEA